MKGTNVVLRFAVAVVVLSAPARAASASADFPDEPMPAASSAAPAPPTLPEVPVQLPPRARPPSSPATAAPALTTVEPAVPRAQIDGRLALAVAVDNSIYALTQVDATYRILPFLLVGGYVEHPFVLTVNDDEFCGNGGVCPVNYFAFGPRVELQPFPESIVGPWLGASLGLALLDGLAAKVAAALETTFDVGVEIRPVKALAIGPYLATKVFLTDPYKIEPENPSPEYNGVVSLGVVSLGVRAAVRAAGRL